MAKTSILTILIQLAKTGNADKETIKGLASLKAGVGQAMGAFAAFAGVAYTVDKALDATVGTFVNYAAQVREMNRLTGAGSEETSRLIQMADDLTISYESLQKSMWFASKNGTEVNVESLSRLADEYVALGSPMEQADFLAKNFGKSGAEMAKMLEQGGNAVRAWASSIEGSLVLTDRAVQEAREYELALDELNDQWEAMKVGIGQKVVPALNDMLFALNNNQKIIEERNRLIKEGIQTDFIQANQLAINNVRLQEFNQTLYSSATYQQAWAEQTKGSTDALIEQGETMDQINQRNTDMLSLIMNLQGQNDSYNESLTGLTEKMAALKTEQDGYLAGSEKYNEIQAEIDETGAAIEQLASDHEAASNRIAFSLLQQKMAVGGLEDFEFDALLKIGQAWGLVDEATVKAAQDMVTQIAHLTETTRTAKSQVNELKSQWEKMMALSGSVADFFININVSGSIPSMAPWMGDVGLGGDAPVVIADDGNQGTTDKRASGGPLGSGWTMVGEQGFEIISPNGFVFTHEQSKQMIAGGIVPGQSFLSGGPMQWSEPPDPVPQIPYVPSGGGGGGVKVKKRRERGELSGGNAAAAASAAVNEAVIPLAETTAQASQNAQAAAQVTQAEMQATREEIARGNDLMQGIRDDLRRNSATTRNSFLAAAESIRG